MSTISSHLPSVSAAAVLDRNAKPSGPGQSRSAADAVSQLPVEAPDPQASNVTADLDAALARIQGQNQASALTNIRDLDEAQALTRLARQSITASTGAARSVHAGVTPATALRVLQD
jgi:hypothetical protein